MLFVFGTRSTLAATNTYSNNTSAPIADSGPGNCATSPAGPATVSTINVPDNGSITDLNVYLNISHTWVADLIVTLTSPGGTTVTLVDRPGVGVPVVSCGFSTNNITATLDDSAASPVENANPPTAGPYRPNSPLSAFNGQNLSGTWTLRVTDISAGDTGTLNSWQLIATFNAAAAAPVTENPATLTFSDARVNYLTNSDGAAPTVVYCNQSSGITVYGVDGNSQGYLLAHVPFAQIEEVGVPTNGNVILWNQFNIVIARLTTGEFQLNTTYADGKPYSIVWSGCPSTSYYHLAR